MTLKLAYNTTDSAIVVDEAGYSIGGHEWGPYDTTDKIAGAELGAGRLIEVDEKAARKAGNPLVDAALLALDSRKARLEQAKAADKEQLAEALDPEVLDRMDAGGDGLPAKDELVEAVVASDVTVTPEPAPKKSTSSRTAAKK